MFLGFMWINKCWRELILSNWTLLLYNISSVIGVILFNFVVVVGNSESVVFCFDVGVAEVSDLNIIYIKILINTG